MTKKSYKKERKKCGIAVSDRQERRNRNHTVPLRQSMRLDLVLYSPNPGHPKIQHHKPLWRLIRNLVPYPPLLVSEFYEQNPPPPTPPHKINGGRHEGGWVYWVKEGCDINTGGWEGGSQRVRIGGWMAWGVGGREGVGSRRNHCKR